MNLSVSMEIFLKSGAVLSCGEGRVLAGWGKAQWFSELPIESGGPVFYFPDFFLSKKAAYAVYPFWTECFVEDVLENISVPLEERPLLWAPVEKKEFEAAFDCLQSLFIAGKLKKGVPFCLEKSVQPFIEENLRRSLVSALRQTIDNPLFIYGFWDNEGGMLGLTPELLFSMRENRVATMALAGTAPKGCSEIDFLNDPKESKEHRLVIEAIRDSLSDFGRVLIGKTQVLELPALCHLLSPIELEADCSLSFEDLVRALHPTPALGVFPRTEGWDWLSQLQQKIDRGRFGAPVGFFQGAEGCCYVAIRNIQWNRESAAIAAGCGVVAESCKEKEWEEILLKLKSVKKALSL